MRGAVLFIIIILFVSCQSSPTEPDPSPRSQFYLITAVTVNIFDDSPAGGTIELNGEQKNSGGAFQVENGNINSLSVEAAGFYPDYIVCQTGSGVNMLTRDKSGLHASALTSDITLYLKLIPSDFDAGLLSRCVGGDSWDVNPNSFGDGTVQRFKNSIVSVGMTEGTTGAIPTSETEDKLKAAVGIINNAVQGFLRLEYAGQGHTGIDLLYVVDKVDTPTFHLNVLNNNIIFSSGFNMKNNATLKDVLEGVVRTLGIRRNGGGVDYPYLSSDLTSPAFINDGDRALQLIYLLPPGFEL